MQLLEQPVLEDLRREPGTRPVNRRIVLNSRPVGVPSAAN